MGMLVFLGGVALLAYTFQTALGMFRVPAQEALGIKTGKPVDLNEAGARFAGVLVRVLLLVVMAIVGSLVANRGIHLYSQTTAGRRRQTPEPPDDEVRFLEEGGSGGHD